MAEKLHLPDIKRIKERAAKIQEIRKRADANISILDDIIAQLRDNIRSSPVYQYRLKKAKRLLNFADEDSEQMETNREPKV